MANMTSSLIVKLIDHVSGPARGVSRSLHGLNNAAKGSFGSGLGTAIARNNEALARARGGLVDAAAGFYLLKTAIAAPINAAANFETALEDIGQKANIPQQRLGALGEQIRKVATTTNQSIFDIAGAIDSLVGRGASEDVALAAAAPIGKAATAYRASADDLAAASWAVVDNLKVPAGQIGTALDMMAQAGKEGAFELKDMATYFPALASAYQGVGQSGTDAVADLAAALQVVRKGTGDSASAATNLQNVIQKMASPATRRAFKKMGVDLGAALSAAGERGLTPIEAIAEITNDTLKGDLSKIGFLFEDAQAQAGVRALIQNMDEYRRIREEASGATGVVDEDFARRLETANGAIKRWDNSLTNFGVTLGETLLPLISDLLDYVTPIVSAIGDWVKANPGLSSGLLSAAAGLVAFKTAITALSFVGLLGKGGALSLLSAGFGGLGDRIDGAGKSVGKFRRLGGLGTGLGLLGAVNAIGVASDVGNFGKAVGQDGGKEWLARRDANDRAIEDWLRNVNVGGFKPFKAYEDATKYFHPESEGGAAAPTVPVTQPTQGNIDALKAEIASLDAEMAEWPEAGMAERRASLTAKLTDMIAAQKAAMQGAGEQAGQSYATGIAAQGPGIVSQMQTILSQMRLLAASGVTIPIRANQTIGSPGPTLDGVPVSGHRANGGPVWSGGSFLVGERQPEVFTPKSAGTITPAGKMGGNTITFGNIIVHGASDPAATANAVMAKIEDRISALLRGAHSDSEAWS